MQNRILRCSLRLGASLVLTLLLTGGARAADATDDARLGAQLSPSPQLGPARVVQIQLEALRHNDAHDRGIEVAFRFASPDNKRSTGPLPRFASMLRNGPYQLMLSFVTAAYDQVEIAGDKARQRVILLGKGVGMGYTFYLSRHDTQSCKSCWMTDAVSVEPMPGKQA